MPYAQLIVNPIAGAGKTAKKLPFIIALLNDLGFDYSYVLTEGPQHALELAQDAIKHDYKMIVSVGGDGTINEIVNGVYHTGSLDKVLIGIISTGTGADYIRTVGIPRSYEEACKKLINPQINRVDLGIAKCTNDGKFRESVFINFSGLGFDAEIVKKTTLKYKAMGRVSAYLLALFTTLITYGNKTVTIDIKGESAKVIICTVIAGNGRFGGGGMMTTPDADIRDGLLDVLVVGNLSKPDLLISLPRIYNGTHLSHPKVTLSRTNEVTIKSNSLMTVQADGEIIGETPVTFGVLPSAMNLVV